MQAAAIIYEEPTALAALRTRIAAAAAASRPARPAESVRLLAVSKRQSDQQVIACRRAGQQDFGENYVQEIIARIERLPADSDIEWHLIGALQSNKTAAAARHCSWVHSIDRLKTARRLAESRSSAGMEPINVCVQVNLGGEAGKGGVSAGEAGDLGEEISRLGGIRLRGLMCIPEAGAQPALLRERFSRLRSLQEEISGRCGGLDTLSMGMSSDFELAIREGSTMVRIGSALFGARSQ
ncbi:MAG: YggS family pyridoxal phosphate-dependent enzyme [Betaproteobacteria bacterium]|nr:YggS family pyridoxal phosphate-dependent enzyme [Betaproteobacteria bacterium]